MTSGSIHSIAEFGRRLRDGIHQVLQNPILRDPSPDQDRVYFNLQSNCLTNSYNYPGLPADEWLHGSERADAMLQQLSQMLNSNENFEMNDSFKLSFTNVRGVSRGTGQRKRKPGDSHPETFKRIKRSIVMIDDNDNLCCARAIVTAKAKVDGNPNWEGFKKGRTIQNHQGILLQG